jgi:hypothetical protein
MISDAMISARLRIQRATTPTPRPRGDACCSRTQAGAVKQQLFARVFVCWCQPYHNRFTFQSICIEPQLSEHFANQQALPN